MEFLNKIFAKAVDTTPHAAGEFYLKIKTDGELVKATAVQETDPTVPSHVKNIKTAQISDWNTAFSWGDFREFGLGVNTQTLFGEALSTLTSTRFYSHSSGQAPSDAAVAVQSLGIHLHNPWGRVQISIPNAGTSAGHVFVRASSNTSGTTFNAWRRLWDTNDFSQSSINNWNTAFGWGNHAGLYRPVSWVPSWTDVTGLATILDGKVDKAGDTMVGKLILHDVGVALNMPNIGTANPAGTVNGDIWFRSNTLFFNSNGTVREVAHTSSWAAMPIAEMRAGTATTSRFIRSDFLNQWINEILENYAEVNHTHPITEVNGLEAALSEKASLSHNHSWDQITEKPNFNNVVNVLEINSNSLSGNGTIEEQVASFINSNTTITRGLNSSALFIKLVGYEPENPNPDPDPEPQPSGAGTTAVSSGLRVFYDFAAPNWLLPNNSNVKNFAMQYTPGVNDGLLNGSNGHQTGNGGYYRFSVAGQRFIDTAMTTNGGLNISLNSYTLVYVVRSYTNLTGDKFVFGSNVNLTTFESLHSGLRTDFIYHDHRSASIGTQAWPQSVNQWVHVVITQQMVGSTVSRADIYLNGIQRNGFDVQAFRGNNFIHVGAWNGASYDVDVGLCMIYNRALSAAEVTTLFNEQKGRFGL